ncbi:LTA synthase family protein [Shewanella marina]|uniref:LTA synthase family protein n=1 Tax=Shewanella marina TaxID=487319 RepID=UPI000470E984|nr:LTA synthase family protein [Shewanella marina]
MKTTNPLKLIIFFGLICLLVMTLSRLGLSLWQFDRVAQVDGFIPVFLQGFRVDIATLCWLLALPALGSLIFATGGRIGEYWRTILRLYLTLLLLQIVFIECSTPSFIEEYGLRPNRLYVEYLVYPKEVFSMLWAGRKFEILLGLAIAVSTVWAGWRLSAGYQVSSHKFSWRIINLCLVVLVVVCGARSSVGHRPLNPAMVAFSVDPLVNGLVVNSSYSVLFAISQMRNEADASQIYGDMATDEIIDWIRLEAARHQDHFISSDFPSLSVNHPSAPAKAKNLVIILQESLGARFVGCLGGKPLTPNIDELSKQSWNFNRLYATGTRSVRGIEAIITGFTPTPARSVVKLGKSQTHFFTIAQLLAEQGYHTSFIYGGESHFDNMRSFFLGNGFNHIIDEDDFVDPVFSGSWGVSDEDLMVKADSTFSQLQQQGKPFFSLVFSSSNHDPFEFPDDRIELYEQPKQTRNNAAKYADYAVGEFFKLAKQSNYWDDTLFLVIADHDSRVGGAQLVPISRFHIPGMLIGKQIDVRQDDRLVSQIDMAPTLLSLLGITAHYPMIGRDLTAQADDWPGRAMMQYDRNFAYMQGNDVVVLQPNKPVVGFEYNFNNHDLIPKSQPEKLADRALAIALWGSMAYQNSLYQIPTN